MSASILRDPVVYRVMMAELPHLVDRFWLACCSRSNQRCAELYDAALNHMRLTWAFPRLTFETRLVILLESHFIDCVRWAWEHRQPHQNRPSFFYLNLARCGFIPGLELIVAKHRSHTASMIVRELFKYDHVEKAIAYFEKHAKPRLGDTIASCVSAALCACHPLADAHVMRNMPDWTKDDLRVRAFAIMFTNPKDRRAILAYHWDAIPNVVHAIRLMRRAMDTLMHPRIQAMSKSFAGKRAFDAGIDQDEFTRIWNGVH
jgi:hypothetical protein